MKTPLKSIMLFLALITFSFLTKITILADNTPNFTQQITAGTLTVDIVDNSYDPVANPSVAMSNVNFSAACKTSTGTLGTVSQKMYVENPDQADAGWNVSIAATAGPTGFWDNLGAGTNYDFNDASGCTDGGDADSIGGRMTINPASGTLSNGQCTSCSTTGVSLGSSASFTQGSVDSITLLSASASADDVADYTVTGMTITQQIPAAQSVNNYEVDMTLTVTAL